MRNEIAKFDDKLKNLDRDIADLEWDTETENEEPEEHATLPALRQKRE